MTRLLKSAAVFWFCSIVSVDAHLPFETTTIVRLQHRRLEMVVTFSNDAAATLLRDENQGMINSAAFNRLRPLFLKHAPRLYEVTAHGESLLVERTDVSIRAGGEVAFIVIYQNPSTGPLRFDAVFLHQLPLGFSSSLAIFDADEEQLGSKILMSGATTLEIPLPRAEGEAIIVKTEPQEPAKPAPSFQEFLKLGIEHILTGYDHLLFLCGLLVACRSIRSMLAVITCFTIAHSFTLALAALNLATIPSRIVEPLIAVSIIFIGVENLIFGEAGKGRALVAFGFGLVHGFGFANALRETGLATSGASLIVPLFSFNLGVETGQIVVAAIFVPILWQLRKVPLFARCGTPAISACVVILGGWWLLQRTLLS